MTAITQVRPTIEMPAKHVAIREPVRADEYEARSPQRSTAAEIATWMRRRDDPPFSHALLADLARRAASAPDRVESCVGGRTS